MAMRLRKRRPATADAAELGTAYGMEVSLGAPPPAAHAPHGRPRPPGAFTAPAWLRRLFGLRPDQA